MAMGRCATYPGSPALIAAALRKDDLLDACELHPEDARTLRKTLSHAKRAGS